MEDIVTGPGQTSLGNGEVVVSFFLPPRPARTGDAYLRFIPRTEMDIAVVGVGVCVTLDEGRHLHRGPGEPRRGGTAHRCSSRKRRTRSSGPKLDDEAMANLAAAASAACNPIDDKRGTKTYRIKVAGVLARRTAGIASEAGEEQLSDGQATCNHDGERGSRASSSVNWTRPCSTPSGTSSGSPAARRAAVRATAGRAASCSTGAWCAPASCSRRSPRVARSRPSRGWRTGDQLHPLQRVVPRGGGAPVRHLHAGLPDRGEGASRPRPRPQRDRDPVLAGRQPLPLHRIRQDRPRGADRRRRKCARGRERWVIRHPGSSGSAPARCVPTGSTRSRGARTSARTSRCRGCSSGESSAAPIAHARIAGIDASAALAVPGVKAVVTAEDFPDIPDGDSDGGRGSDELPGPLVQRHGPGQGRSTTAIAVAAVAATSRAAAEEAVDRIRVDYEVLPHVIEVLDAMEPGAPAPARRTCSLRGWIRSRTESLERRVAGASFRSETSTRGSPRRTSWWRASTSTEAVHQGYIEPHAAVASVGEDGHCTDLVLEPGPVHGAGVLREASRDGELPAFG